MPQGSKEISIGKRIHNARSEAIADVPSLRDAWRQGQHCVIPAEALHERDWRSSRAVPIRIACADGDPTGIAGLWAALAAPSEEVMQSDIMLILKADKHPLMRQFHKPGEEKRMVVVLPEAQYGAWLQADMDHSRDFLQPFPAELMQAQAPGQASPDLLG